VVRTCNCTIGLRQVCVEAEVRTRRDDSRLNQTIGHDTREHHVLGTLESCS
jgi:hypothetical protein